MGDGGHILWSTPEAHPECVASATYFVRNGQMYFSTRWARHAVAGRPQHDPRGSPPASSTSSTAERLGLAGGATRGLCCGHLGRSSGASQRLGRASFTHAATTGMRGPSVEFWCELHVRGGCGHSRSTRRTSKLAVGVLSWRERETAAEEPSAVASQRLPGSPGGSPCPF